MAFTDTEARQLALDVFGIDGAPSQLPAEFGANFRIEGADQTYVLKIAPVGADPTHLDLENAVMHHLQDPNVDVAIPRPVPARDGTFIALAPNGLQFVRLVTWIDGIPYLDAGRPSNLALGIGRAVGTVSKALTGFEHASATRSLLWNMLEAPETIMSRAVSLQDPDLRSLVQRISDHFANKTAQRLATMPHQVLHNDANDLNVIVAGGAVSGLIDFGDVVKGPAIIDAAVAATYAMFDQDDPLAVGAAVLAGFAESAGMDGYEGRLAFDLVMMRLALSLTIAASNRDETNAHRSVSTRDARDLIERLAHVDRDVGAAVLAGENPPQ